MANFNKNRKMPAGRNGKNAQTVRHRRLSRKAALFRNPLLFTFWKAYIWKEPVKLTHNKNRCAPIHLKKRLKKDL